MKVAATHGRDVKTLSKETLRTRKEMSHAHMREREIDEELIKLENAALKENLQHVIGKEEARANPV